MPLCMKWKLVDDCTEIAFWLSNVFIFSKIENSCIDLRLCRLSYIGRYWIMNSLSVSIQTQAIYRNWYLHHALNACYIASEVWCMYIRDNPMHNSWCLRLPQMHTALTVYAKQSTKEFYMLTTLRGTSVYTSCQKGLYMTHKEGDELMYVPPCIV